MHLVVAPYPAVLAGRGRIVDHAVAAHREIDHAIGRPEQNLLLRPGYGLIDEQIADRPSAVGHRVVMVRSAPGAHEFYLPASDPVADVQICDRPGGACRQNATESQDRKKAKFTHHSLPSRTQTTLKIAMKRIGRSPVAGVFQTEHLLQETAGFGIDGGALVVPCPNARLRFAVALPQIRWIHLPCAYKYVALWLEGHEPSRSFGTPQSACCSGPAKHGDGACVRPARFDPPHWEACTLSTRHMFLRIMVSSIVAERHSNEPSKSFSYVKVQT